MDIFIKVVQLILSLSILVIVHEFGHFIAAKVFKARVEKFYLFFNPWFALFKFRKGETEYGVGWLPLGGYVKISGMIDESMDKKQMSQEPQPHEFRSKPAWQRLIIMLGGVTMNIILAILIYIVMLITWGEEFLPVSEVKYGITVDSVAHEMGLRNGDHIVSIENEPVEDFADVPHKILLNNATTIQVIRDGQPFEVKVPEGSIAKLIKQKSPDFISLRFPFDVRDFVAGSVGKKAGIKEGDRIIGLNEKTTLYFDEFFNELQQNKNKDIVVKLLRQEDTVLIPVKVPAEGKLGIYPQTPDHYFKFSQKNYSVFEAIPAGFTKTYQGVNDYFKQLKLIFSKEVKAYESVGGFMTVGSIFPSTWDWEVFWRLTAFLSIMLAILNILPIPALDGGHVMFVLYEIVVRRKPSDKFLEYAQIVGMVILFGILIFANGNDIYRFFFK